jgi:uncharacterized Zn finger protein
MAETSKLKKILTRDVLRRLAGTRSFERGAEYFVDGQVTSLFEHAGKLTATVQGTQDYQVEMSIRGNALDYNCTCPVGADGEFCKHCVAAGLAWLANGPGKPSAAKRGVTETPGVTLDDARAWLGKQDKPKLVEMLLHQALNDTHLREQLLLQAAKTAGHGLTVATIRNALDRATRTGGFVDYRNAYDFSLGIDEVVDSIAGLLKQGYAAEVIGLTEYALDKVEQATLNMDDSNGYMGGILQRLQQWHLEACRKAKPDSVSLAGRLFEWELRTQFDTFHGAANVYARVLGKHGLAAYRRRAEAVWASVPEIMPGQKDPAAFGKNYRIKNIMEALARLSGDVELLVAVKARDLSHAYAFLQIAEIYREAGRPDQALDWAEKGIKAFPQRTDSRLREFLADEYHRRRRHDEAMELVWKIFAEGESLEHYRTLKQHADRVRQWPAWRAKALEFIRAEIVREKKEQAQKRQAWGWIPAPVDHSLLVQIFLWEKDLEAAWREAQSGGCHDGLWMELARLREGRFPGDVVPVYQRQVELLVNQKSSASYREAARLLGKVRDLMTKLGQADQFRGYLAAVRATHKPKRNFIKLAARL